MQVQHSHSTTHGKFFVEEAGRRLGELYYSTLPDGALRIDHTEVLPAGQGKGLGKQLVQAAVDHARAAHIKVLPVCPFAAALFDKMTDWEDVVIKYS